jgi:hypothetical protein
MRCPHCGEEMRRLALIEVQSVIIDKILEYLHFISPNH